MQVKDILESFKDRDPEEEVAIAWWDKKLVEEDNDTKLTEEQWHGVAHDIDGMDWSRVNDDISEIVTAEVKEQ